ncbi:hypothetical protein CPB86DRAFT_875963 [Serendipita vermifera]|nr:hypothetical protein CPB86DRAFT_875963 [Serendipita vermifera]
MLGETLHQELAETAKPTFIQTSSSLLNLFEPSSRLPNPRDVQCRKVPSPSPRATKVESPKTEVETEAPSHRDVLVPSNLEEEASSRPNERNKGQLNVLLFGEEGVGKDMFISWLNNMCRGRKIQEFKSLSESKVEATVHKGESTAYLYTSYTIPYITTSPHSGSPSKVFRILDVFGLEDVHKFPFDFDDSNVVAGIIEKELTTINAIIIMVCSIRECLSATTRYALEILSSVIPKTATPNVGFLVMNHDGVFKLDRECLPKEYRDARLLLISNPLVRWYEYEAAKGNKISSFKEKLELKSSYANQLYEEALRLLNGFFEWLDTRPPQPIESTIEQVTITQASSSIVSLIDTERTIRRQITQLQADIHENDSIINLNRFNQKVVQRRFWDRVYTPRKNTICTVDGCHSNCHKSCKGEYMLTSQEIGKKCWAFRHSDMRMGTNALCTECKHMLKYHLNVNDLWEFKYAPVLIINEEEKKAFNNARSEKERNEKAKAILEQTLSQVDKQINEGQERLKALCKQYEELAIPNSFISRISPAIELLRYRYDIPDKCAVSSDAISELYEIIEGMGDSHRTSPGDQA